jgi:hypothetical protein
VLLVHGGNRPDEDGRSPPRLPAGRLDAVGEALARVVAALQPSGVVSAGAAGADLLVLDAAARLGVPVHIVVPIAEAQFVAQSVEDAGGDWVERWDGVVAAARADPASSVVSLELAADSDWYREANGALLDAARRLAGEGEPIVVLTVRPPEGEHPPSVTDDLAERAVAAGLVVLTLDPRPPGHEGGGVRLTVTPGR